MSTSDHELMMYHLLSVHAGGPEYIDHDQYEMTGEADSTWYMSLTELCGQAHDCIKGLEAERDALAGVVEQQRRLLREHFDEWEADTGKWDEFDWHDRVSKCLQETPTVSLDRLIAEKQIEALKEVVGWLDPDSETFAGPTYHEAELIGMAISGPMHCSSVAKCHLAGKKAFEEAARIFSFRNLSEDAAQ